MWTMVWWYRQGLTPNLSTMHSGSHQFCLAVLSAELSLESVGEWTKDMRIVYPSSWNFKRSLTFHKILLHGTSGFNSHRKECVLRNFIALKNPFQWPGSNRRPLVPVASTLNFTPPRQRTIWYVIFVVVCVLTRTMQMDNTFQFDCLSEQNVLGNALLKESLCSLLHWCDNTAIWNDAQLWQGIPYCQFAEKIAEEVVDIFLLLHWFIGITSKNGVTNWTNENQRTETVHLGGRNRRWLLSPGRNFRILLCK
jgi:hypothetical protein